MLPEPFEPWLPFEPLPFESLPLEPLPPFCENGSFAEPWFCWLWVPDFLLVFEVSEEPRVTSTVTSSYLLPFGRLTVTLTVSPAF